MFDDRLHTRIPSAHSAASPPQAEGVAPAASPTGRVPRTRAGATWSGICAAALLSVVLIVFIGQNSRSVQVNFLGMGGSLPLALALLIAAVGAAILTMVVGTVRIAQLRRLSHQRR
ncbi:putative integral membrane protein [Actinoplanes campanulatus]|uniref:Putative integral membrane protein n=1 Tax=Actinoplanes campanulatus TaxID=113559 RepID=A0A7W5AH04_9ACTN|nr:lipopolysaccharide assembly protein LapA domain-containing protein [Actinoplanes campanulatus]MBB3095917.1 putative integral membrane protein [Actinoplanes campanulatus]